MKQFMYVSAFTEEFFQAEWEELDSEEEREQLKRNHWINFSNVVGYNEMARLRRMNINYRIPPPGIK